MLKTLKILGFNPTKETSKNIIFKSPFNPSEKTPSFHIFPNSSGGYSYKDYSSGNGGDIYNFIMKYFSLNFPDAKHKLQELTGDYREETIKIIPKIESPEMKIIKTSTLQHPQLIDYLCRERGISPKFHKYLGEVHYQIGEKTYFAISFGNDSGSRELRNKYFKGSIGKKDISTFKLFPSQKRVKVFEGFMDFLSFLEFKKGMEKSDYIIMNSTSLIDKTIKAIQGKYDHVDLYLDNDKSGDEATAKIILECGCNTEDKRVFYKGFNDLNSRLINKVV